MRLKLYRSDDIDAAVKTACQELGEDAMLISVESTLAQEFPLGRYRIVFANRVPELVERPIAKNTINRDRVPYWDDVRSSLGKLLDQLSVPPEQSNTREVQQFLVECGVRRTDAQPLVQALEDSTIRELLERTIVQQPSSSSTIAVFVGPAGSGKTTAVDKLALRESADGKRVLIVRAFQTEQAHRLAPINSRILELSVAGVSELGVVGNLQSSHDLILIDTSSHLANLPASESTGFSDWIKSNDACVHLVLNACTRWQEWQQCTSKFDKVRPFQLLLTHLDEVISWAGVWSAVSSSQFDCSYFSSGPRVTDPIDVARPERFLGEFIELSNKVKQIGSTKLAAKSAASTN